MTTTAEVPVASKILWTMHDLKALTGLCRATIERMVARGELPRPTKCGKRRVWNATAVRASIDELTKGQGAAAS